MVLQQANPPPPFENEAPIIDSLAVSTNEVEPGASVTLSATAHDNNPGDTLTYAWSAPGGTFIAPSSSSTTWTAPTTEGVQRLQLEVRDSRNATATVTVDLTVRPVGVSGRAAMTVRLNTWPEVSAMMGAPSVLAVGRTTQLAASVADPNGDTVFRYWVSTCVGTFDAVDSRTPTFTLSAEPPEARCIFTVYVSDTAGGYHSGNLTLQVGSGPQVNMQRVPVVDSVYQSAQQVDIGGLLSRAGRPRPDGWHHRHPGRGDHALPPAVRLDLLLDPQPHSGSVPSRPWGPWRARLSSPAAPGTTRP